MRAVQLGDICRDTITGYTGTVVCISTWLHGCRRITMQASELKDGKPVEPYCCDEPQLETIRTKAHKSTDKTGGPRPAPVSKPY